MQAALANVPVLGFAHPPVVHRSLDGSLDEFVKRRANLWQLPPFLGRTGPHRPLASLLSLPMSVPALPCTAGGRGRHRGHAPQTQQGRGGYLPRHVRLREHTRHGGEHRHRVTCTSSSDAQTNPTQRMGRGPPSGTRRMLRLLLVPWRGGAIGSAAKVPDSVAVALVCMPP